jgi:hypothetical protein
MIPSPTSLESDSHTLDRRNSTQRNLALNIKTSGFNVIHRMAVFLERSGTAPLLSSGGTPPGVYN